MPAWRGCQASFTKNAWLPAFVKKMIERSRSIVRVPAIFHGDMDMFEGACLCGEVRYRVDREIEELSHCHCSMCRQLHGAAFGTYAGEKSAGFHWLSGASKVKSYTSSPGVKRTFCAICGSTLQALFDTSPEMVYLTMGTVQGNPVHPEPFHIFVGSKAPWFTITDDYPQYDEWRDHP
jgi:hypothetical protein